MKYQYVDHLVTAIVMQACRDYRAALAGKKVDGKDPEWVIQECESFFFSHWFSILTDLDPHYIVDSIREEFDHERKKKHDH